MLKKQLLVSASMSPNQALSVPGAISVLSEFKVENSYYRVVVLRVAVAPGTVNATDTNRRLSAFFAKMGIDQFSEVARFELKGHLCLIIETPCRREQETNRMLGAMSSVLTERELQIAALVALGKVNKQIAKQLKISEWTVATYLRRMFAKLSVDSRAALVYRCAPLIKQFQALNTSVTES